MASRILHVIGWLIWILAAASVFAAPALAWGPGAHIECSTFLLKNLILLAPAMRRLLRHNPFAFIYGSVCPDMVLGKRLMSAEKNNHNWNVGFKLLGSAASKREEAFAMGYLTHLAADTVAHNLFIPDQLLHRFDRRRRGHVTLELLFDSMLDDDIWTMARTVARKPFPDCEALLHRALPRAPLPKRVNKRLFRSGALMVRTGQWQKIIRELRDHWDHELNSLNLASYIQAVHNTVIEFLNDTSSAPCLQQSPMGRPVLARAETLKKTMKRLKRDDCLGPERYSTLVSDFRLWRVKVLSPQPAAS